MSISNTNSRGDHAKHEMPLIRIEQSLITKEPLVCSSEDKIKIDYKDVPDFVFDEIKNKGKATKAGNQHAKSNQVRVDTSILNEIAKTAAEGSIEHSRLEETVFLLDHYIEELTDTVVRLDKRVREYEIEAETNIAAHKEGVVAQSVETRNNGDEFDSLEFDEFNEQTIRARAFLEDVSDITSIKNSISKAVNSISVSFKLQRANNERLLNASTQTRLEKFGTQQSRLVKLVRQIAKETKKNAIPQIRGADEPVDRRTIEALMGPIEHVVRNAVDHGVESVEQRAAAKKPLEATIIISAETKNHETIITIKDDGKGVNLKDLYAKALERKLIKPGARITKSEIIDLITAPGFTTAKKITSISGRGVGMDVVKTAVKELGGRLELNTAEGKGTTIRIIVPINNSATKCLLVRSQKRIYALPVNTVESVAVEDGSVINGMFEDTDLKYVYQNENYNIVSLQEGLGMQFPGLCKAKEKHIVVLLKVGEKKLAVHVDELLKTQLLIAKPPGRQISKLSFVSSSSTLGNGEIVPILDVPFIIANIISKGIVRDVNKVVMTPKEVKKIIMVVDDSITIRKSMEILLGEKGFVVETAKDGSEAVLALVENETMPSVILLDIEMPNMDGFDVLSRIRSMDRTRHIPVIMITSRTADKHRNKAIRLGANHYMGKPPSANELFEKINGYIAADE